MISPSLNQLKWQKISIVSLHQLEQIYKKDSPYQKRFTDFLKRLNPENFVINHTTADEIDDLINSFPKSVSPHSIPNKIMKIAKGIISSPFRGRGRGGGAPPPFFLQSLVFYCNHFEELKTVLFEVELIINNKPLTNVYPNTIKTYFTPNHLLFSRQLLCSSKTT